MGIMHRIAHHCKSVSYSASSSWTVRSLLASFLSIDLSAASFAELWRSSKRLNTLHRSRAITCAIIHWYVCTW